MIKLSIMYPNREGGRFDLDYYVNRHMSMVRTRLGDACIAMSVEAGLSGVAPGSKPTYIATAHLAFESVESFQSAFGPNAPEFGADVPNYTDIDPVLQLSEIKS